SGNAHSMQPVTAVNTLASNGFSPAGRSALRLVFGALLLAALAACSLPFGLGTATERALESGVTASLSSSSLELAGSYTGPGVAIPGSGAGSNAASSTSWSIDLQLNRPANQHLTVSGTNLKVEAIITAGDAYFRGQQFLSDHMGDDPLS